MVTPCVRLLKVYQYCEYQGYLRVFSESLSQASKIHLSKEIESVGQSTEFRDLVRKATGDFQKETLSMTPNTGDAVVAVGLVKKSRAPR